MMGEERHIELFERYRSNELSESELKDFEARLAYDTEFKIAFEEYECVEEGIKNHFRNELKSKLQEVDKAMDNPKEKKNNAKSILIWSTSVAASIIIGILLLQHFSSSNHVELAQQYWPSEPGLPVKMSSNGKYDDAMNAYKLGEFDKANSLLKKISSDTSYYFQGVISFEQDDNTKAKEFFNQIDKSSNYYNTAQFRLGLIFLSEGDLRSAKKIFKAQMAENSQFAGASKEILRKI
jgi:TolA-binding protein